MTNCSPKEDWTILSHTRNPQRCPISLHPCTLSSNSKGSACDAGDQGSIPGLGSSSGEGNGNPLQYSCLENTMDREAWWATVRGVAKSRTRLSDFTFTFTFSLQSLLLQLLLCFFIHKGLQSISRTVKLIYSLFISMS